MLTDDQVARMEYLAACTEMPLADLCAELAGRLAIPEFELAEDDECARAFSFHDQVEYNVTWPRSGSLRDWLPYAPEHFTHGVNLTIGRQHATIKQREWDFAAIAAPVGQALADITGQDALHYGSWISAARTTRRDTRFRAAGDAD
ncbi:MAG: hypothetical protein KDA42_07380 [Planctomycetales bacterium]|nr:hypothetical protein [Planctomycetales bacterium]